MPRVVKSSLLRLAVLTAAVLSVLCGIGQAATTTAPTVSAAHAATAAAPSGSVTDDWNNTGASVPPAPQL